MLAGSVPIGKGNGAQIVPIAFEKYGKDFVVNIGENISATDFDLSKKQDLTDILRNSMATLKWEIWSRMLHESRSSTPDGYREQYLRGFVDQLVDDSYSLEAIEITRFHTKTEIAQREVAAHSDKLIPCRENAFLFCRQKIDIQSYRSNHYGK